MPGDCVKPLINAARGGTPPLTTCNTDPPPARPPKHTRPPLSSQRSDAALSSACGSYTFSEMFRQSDALRQLASLAAAALKQGSGGPVGTATNTAARALSSSATTDLKSLLAEKIPEQQVYVLRILSS